MRELDNLKKRLMYAGGNQEQRFINDKLKSLKKALLYSYQAATLVTLDEEGQDDKEFRCLINPDKTKNDYDQKMLSIPFEDICLNSPMIGTTTEGVIPTGIKSGDVFKWKEQDNYWLIYLRYLEEDAYFRAEIRRCKEVVNINGHEYHVYVRGPVETTIQWLQKLGVSWNKLNYSLELYITKNEETLDYFKRFQYLTINGNRWEVLAKDYYGGDGIIQVILGEAFNNTIEEERYEEPKPSEPIITEEPVIKGLDVVKPYTKAEYSIQNIPNPQGTWSIDSNKVKIINKDSNNLVIEIISGKSGVFEIKYTQDTQEIVLPVKITSLM